MRCDDVGEREVQPFCLGLFAGRGGRGRHSDCVRAGMADLWPAWKLRIWEGSAECSHLCRLVADLTKRGGHLAIAGILVANVVEFMKPYNRRVC